MSVTGKLALSREKDSMYSWSYGFLPSDSEHTGCLCVRGHSRAFGYFIICYKKVTRMRIFMRKINWLF